MAGALLTCFLVTLPCRAVRYERSDSLRVVELLSRVSSQPADVCLPLFFAHQLAGVPYQSATLETELQQGKSETELTVNMRAFDCTTFVETVAALTLTARSGSVRWDDFLRYLTLLRYKDGHIDGYASRNHYFSQWVRNGEHLRLLAEIQGGTDDEATPFQGRDTLELSYMSAHPDAYPALRSDRSLLSPIRRREQEASHIVVSYIPTSRLNGSPKQLADVSNGDIVALVCRTPGLDVSHMGFAAWGSDGQLHLLHASSRAGRVMLDTSTLHRYLLAHPSMLGARVVRLTEKPEKD